MEIHKGVSTFYAGSRDAWRNWLHSNHRVERSVWLIIYKKKSETPSVYYPEAVDEALCFGWIDSKSNKRDEESYYQYFAKRKPQSNWSKINKDKVEQLISAGLMQPAGLEMVELAKKNGTWTALEDVDNVVLPADLEDAFSRNGAAFTNWESFARSARRGILEWILNAKTEKTRIKRIEETVRLAAENIKANF